MSFENSEPLEVRIGDICAQDRSLLKGTDSNGSDLPYIGLEHVQSDTGDIGLESVSAAVEIRGTTFRFDRRHVLYGKLRPYLNKVALPDTNGRCSTELIPLLPKPGISREYLAAVLRHPRTVEHVMERNTGSRMPRTDMKVLFGIELRLPSVDERRRIVDILHHAASIRRLREQAKAKADDLIPALFLDMFGDLRLNIYGFPTRALREVADIGSGITKGRKLNGAETIEAPYLRVANVQDGFLDLGEVKEISVRPTELPKYGLHVGDLLMTEGGDPDKLGRAALWRGEIPNCVHQNHVFRVRPRREVVDSVFLRALAGSSYGKDYFLRVAKRTTGIASINKTQLGNFPVLLPPIPLQHAFAERVADLEATIEQMNRAAAAVEQLLAALMARLLDGA